MEFITARTMLGKVKDSNSWYGINYNMNIYRGCCHGCIYCDSRSDCYHIDNFDTIRAKENALDILEKELIKKRVKGVIGMGSMSDPYNPMEKTYLLTRGALELIYKYGFGVSIDTKSDLVLRDIDILKKINEKNNVIVKLTVTTPKDELARKIEPNVCVSSKRLNAVKVLNENEIYAGIMMNPMLPFITDNEEDIKELIHKAYENKSKFVNSYFAVTLRENQREYYFKKLDEIFPGVKQKYIKTFGNSYECVVNNVEYLYNIFKDECSKYKILYKMQDIIKEYKKDIDSDNEQITLF